MNRFFHSVYLDEKLCTGCINCIKRCPTEAIRVRNGKAVITDRFCIDCGECIRICSHHAKKIRRDKLDILKNYEYTVALPAPSLYGQFNNLEDINIVLTALLYLGFNDVYEVSGAAEMVSAASRKYVAEHKDSWPIISTACPSVIRLIRIKFPNLIEHMLPINAPVEVAAITARKRAMKKTGLPADKIGIIFLSPCPSKVTFAKDPLGVGKSEIDGVLAIKDIYPNLLPLMKEAMKQPQDLAISGRIGVGWGGSGGEAGGMLTNNYLAADGIENVIKVLEDLEDEKFVNTNLQFIELNACNGGCVGGVLNVENPYVARAKLKKLTSYLPVSLSHIEDNIQGVEAKDLHWRQRIEYEPVFRLGRNMIESIKMMRQVDELCNEFPGLDCGSCGAPTCKALAEDIARGNAEKTDCIHILKTHIHTLSDAYNELAKDVITGDDSDSDEFIHTLLDYVNKLSTEIAILDSKQKRTAPTRKKRNQEDKNDSTGTH